MFSGVNNQPRLGALSIQRPPPRISFPKFTSLLSPYGLSMKALRPFMQTTASRALDALDAVFELVGSKTKPQWPDQSIIWIKKTTTVTSDDLADLAGNSCASAVIRSTSQADPFNERVFYPLHVIPSLRSPSICSQTQAPTSVQFPADLPLEILTIILLLALPPVPDLGTRWTTPLEDIEDEGVAANFWARRADIAHVCRRWRDVLKSQCQILPVPHYRMTKTALTEIQTNVLSRAATFSMALPSRPAGDENDFMVFPLGQDIMDVSWRSLSAFVMEQGFDFSNATEVHQFFGYDAPELRRLYLTGSESSKAVQVVPGSIFNGNAPQLRELVLDFCFVCPQAPFINNLTHLSICYTGSANQPALYAVLHATKSLEHLDLVCALYDEDNALTSDGALLSLPALRHLRIYGAGWLHGTLNLFRCLKASSSLHIEIVWDWCHPQCLMRSDDVRQVRKDLRDLLSRWRGEMEADEVARQLALSDH
ncbi:hypothetical protein HGRIS_004842 [Hohenbuehelia grisea]|uniref:F-box domain-containing protein n=1 Tax=Hohenbuehelia grisea TaxID=104357 RepID=A0ABR3JDZ6_9AGAR